MIGENQIEVTIKLEPFIWKGISWIHPGVEGTKSNFVALSLDDANREFKAEKAKVI